MLMLRSPSLPGPPIRASGHPGRTAGRNHLQRMIKSFSNSRADPGRPGPAAPLVHVEHLGVAEALPHLPPLAWKRGARDAECRRAVLPAWPWPLCRLSLTFEVPGRITR